MSLYAEYTKETSGMDVIELENAFISFRFLDNDDCFIDHIYVRPLHRKGGLATKLGRMVEERAKESGCKRLVGNVNCHFFLPTEATAAFLKFGMRIVSANNNFIFMTKEIY